jgi:chemotaxis protein MotB
MQQRQDRNTQELSNVRIELNEANSRARQAQVERSRLIGERDRSVQQLAVLQTQYDQLRQDAQSSVGDLQSELEAARQDRAEFEQTLAEADELLSRRTDQIEQLQSELAAAARNLASVEAELVSTEQELTGVNAERLAMERLLTEQSQLQEIAEAELVSARQDYEQLSGQLAASQEHVQRLLNERTVLLATIGRMERENTQLQANNTQLQAANTRLQQQLDDTLVELNVAEVELMRREANLDEAVAEHENVVDEYRQAREQLALQQARNEDFSETITELEARLNRETNAMDELQSQLQSLSNERQTLVSRLEDGTTVIKLPESIVFASGSADIGEAGRETLQLLADALESFPDHQISIQGHTDSRSISPGLQRVYPSNWELSTARAASAVRALNQTGIDDERMQAVGYADTRPLVDETDAQSRRANRRIEVLLYPNQFTMKVLDQASIDTP